MSCQINNKKVVQWSIDGEHINQIYTNMYSKVEHGGEIKLDLGSKNSSHVITGDSGKSFTVEAPDAIVNWHTHPISCYLKENTVWGWPSGEDMRSSLLFGLRGSGCHVVSTVEGTYTIQINPCVITSLLNIDKIVDINDYPGINVSDEKWGNFLRGFVIATVELYFKSTHIFRYTQFMKNHQHVTAADFVKFANMFSLSNIFKETPMSNCTPIGCNKVPKYERGKLGITSLKNHVSMYESTTRIYEVDENGESFELKLKYIDVLNNGGLQLLEKLSLGSDCNIPIKAWHKTNMFKLQLFENVVHFRDEWVGYFSLNLNEKIEFLSNKRSGKPDDIKLKANKITFSIFDLAGNCNHNSLVKHMRSYGSTERQMNGKVRRGSRSKSGRSMGKKGKKEKKGMKARKSRRGSKARKSRKKGRNFGKEDAVKDTVNDAVKNAIADPTKILIVGSKECSFCNVAYGKANEPANKNLYTIDTHPSVQDAVIAAQILDNNARTIPAFFSPVNNNNNRSYLPGHQVGQTQGITPQ